MWMIKQAGELRAALLPRARAECGEAAPGGSVGRSWSAPCGRLSLPRDGCCDPGSSLCRCRPGPPHPPSLPTPLPHCQTLSLQHTPAGLGNTVNMCVLLPDLLNQDHFQLFFYTFTLIPHVSWCPQLEMMPYICYNFSLWKKQQC